jgi:hypothetical protein
MKTRIIEKKKTGAIFTSICFLYANFKIREIIVVNKKNSIISGVCTFNIENDESGERNIKTSPNALKSPPPI